MQLEVTVREEGGRNHKHQDVSRADWDTMAPGLRQEPQRGARTLPAEVCAPMSMCGVTPLMIKLMFPNGHLKPKFILTPISIYSTVVFHPV